MGNNKGGATQNKGQKAAAAAKSKGGAKEESSDGGKLKACNHVKGRHILCEKQGKIQEVYKKLQEGWLDEGKKVPPSKFGELAAQYSECSSAKNGGNLGTFPRGKMVGAFQDVAFSTPVGDVSQPFKTQHGWHIFLCEGRMA